MHHHLLGLSALTLVGALIAGPHVVSALSDLAAPPPPSRESSATRADAGDAQAMLSSTIDATLAAARRGRIDETLNAFSTSLEQHAHVRDSDVDAIMDAARSPESRQFLQTLAAAVRHPENVSMPKEGLDARDRDEIRRVAQSLRESLPSR